MIDGTPEKRQSHRDLDRVQTLESLSQIQAKRWACINGITPKEMFLNWSAISTAAYIGAFIRVGLSYLKIW